METKVLSYKETKLNQPQSKSLTYYTQRIEELQVKYEKIKILIISFYFVYFL